MTPNHRSTRSSEMDLARGIGILAVILSHIGFGWPGILFFSFHLPIFFIISGYFFHTTPSVSADIRRRARSLLIPYFCCAGIITLFSFFHSGMDVYILREHLISFALQQRFTTLWFLPVLLGSCILFRLILTLRGPRAGWIPVAVTAGSMGFILYDQFVGVPLPWNLDTAFIALFFVAFGYLLKQKQLLTRLLGLSPLGRLAWSAGLGILSIGCTAVNAAACGETLDMFAGSYGIFPLTVTAACTASVAIIIFCSFLKKCPPLQWLGRNTMAFFAFHQSIGLVLGYDLLDSLGRDLSVHLRRLILFAVTMAVCALIHWLLMLCRMGFVLGKFRQK